MALGQALDYYRRKIPALTLELEVALLSEDDAAAKIQALQCYESWVQARWQTADAMEHSVQEYLKSCGGGSLAERLWAASFKPSPVESSQTIDILP